MKTHDIALNLLSLPPRQWEEESLKYSVSDLQEVERELDIIAQRAFALAKYLSVRRGLTGCGEGSHADAAKAANRAFVKARKAQGYSYPDRASLGI